MKPQDVALKSAFAPMVPRINTELADRLIAQAEQRKAAAEALERETSARRTQSARVATKVARANSALPPSKLPPVALKVNLIVGLVDNAEKINCCWGWIRRQVEESLILGAVLNMAFEPTRRAVAENDLGMIRWLVCLALTERSLNLSAKQFAGETIRGFESRPIRNQILFVDLQAVTSKNSIVSRCGWLRSVVTRKSSKLKLPQSPRSDSRCQPDSKEEMADVKRTLGERKSFPREQRLPLGCPGNKRSAHSLPLAGSRNKVGINRSFARNFSRTRIRAAIWS